MMSTKSMKKTRRCPQCGVVVKSSSLEVLLEHMESSTMCKDAIETCTGCLMKFPDEKTLLKHLSLKKKCQEIYVGNQEFPTTMSSSK